LAAFSSWLEINESPDSMEQIELNGIRGSPTVSPINLSLEGIVR
jgi:hypothetical protein